MMGFEELGERLWQGMSGSERVSFLKALAKMGWDPIETLALVPRFDEVPGNLRGLLIMAMTEEGFSIEKCLKSQKIMDDMANRPT